MDKKLFSYEIVFIKRLFHNAIDLNYGEHQKKIT